MTASRFKGGKRNEFEEPFIDEKELK